MTFVASLWEPGRKSHMTTTDWWDTAMAIVIVLAAVAFGYLLSAVWR